MQSTDLQVTCQPGALSPETALPDLAAQINQAHRACESSLKAGLQHALEAGRLLTQAKAQVAHGEWLPWVQKNCEFSDRTARSYMRLAHGWPALEANRQRAADLSYREAVALLAEPKPSWIGPEECTCGHPQSDHRNTLYEHGAGACNCCDCDQFSWKPPFVDPKPQTLPVFPMPLLSPDHVLAAAGVTENRHPAMMEIYPSAEHPGHFFVGLYRDFDTESPEVVFTGKPARLSEESFQGMLRVFSFAPHTPWIPKAWNGGEPSWLTGGTPGRCRDGIRA